MSYYARLIAAGKCFSLRNSCRILALAITVSSIASLSPSSTLAAMKMADMSDVTPRGAADREYVAAMDAMMRTPKSALTGNADHDFMVLMIPHHQAAVVMARSELRYGSNPHLRRLAADIIRSQSTEISDMERWSRE